MTTKPFEQHETFEVQMFHDDIRGWIDAFRFIESREDAQKIADEYPYDKGHLRIVRTTTTREVVTNE